MNPTTTLKWIGLALLGIAVAAAVAIAASNLASRQIGLASEPISAGDALAPVTSAHRGRSPSAQAGDQGGRRPAPSAPASPTAPSQPSEAAPPTTSLEPSPSEAGDDHGGGSGGGADD